MIRRPPRSTQSRSSAASDVYKRQVYAARVVSEVQPNDDEVMDYQWVDLATMLSALAATPWAFSPWMVLEAENRDARQALTDFVARLRG